MGQIFSRFGFGFGTNLFEQNGCLKTSLRRWQSVAGDLGGETKMRVGKHKMKLKKKVKGVFT